MIINKISGVLNIQRLSTMLVIHQVGYSNYQSEYLSNISKIMSFKRLKDIYIQDILVPDQVQSCRLSSFWKILTEVKNIIPFGEERKKNILGEKDTWSKNNWR